MAFIIVFITIKEGELTKHNVEGLVKIMSNTKTYYIIRFLLQCLPICKIITICSSLQCILDNIQEYEHEVQRIREAYSPDYLSDRK